VINCAKPQDQSKYLIYSATIQSVAGALGYLVGGLIGEYSVSAAFVSQAVLLILSGVAFFLVCYNDADAKSAEKIQIRQFVKEVNPLQAFIDCGSFINKGFVLLFLINALINFGNTGFDQAFNYYLKDQLQLTSAYNGIIKAAVGFVSFVSNMTLCIWIIKKTNPQKSTAIITAICTVAAVGTIFIPDMAVFITLSVIVYAGYSVSVPVLQHLAAEQADPAQKNLVMGFYNATKSLGSIAGSLTAGFIYSSDPKMPFICTAVIYGIGIFAGILYLKQERH
jgi:DHA1 family multidrug resistance protein-like MFS transporter